MCQYVKAHGHCSLNVGEFYYSLLSKHIQMTIYTGKRHYIIYKCLSHMLLSGCLGMIALLYVISVSNHNYLRRLGRIKVGYKFMYRCLYVFPYTYVYEYIYI